MSFPTAVEPVKVTLSTAGCSTRARPATSPRPGTTFSTPAGRPASLASSASQSVDSGVSSDGFITTVHPAASAGASFQPHSSSGKFHAAMAPTTPTGSFSVRTWMPGCETGTVEPTILVGHPAK